MLEDAKKKLHSAIGNQRSKPAKATYQIVTSKVSLLNIVIHNEQLLNIQVVVTVTKARARSGGNFFSFLTSQSVLTSEIA